MHDKYKQLQYSIPTVFIDNYLNLVVNNVLTEKEVQVLSKYSSLLSILHRLIKNNVLDSRDGFYDISYKSLKGFLSSSFIIHGATSKRSHERFIKVCNDSGMFVSMYDYSLNRKLYKPTVRMIELHTFRSKGTILRAIK